MDKYDRSILLGLWLASATMGVVYLVKGLWLALG